MSLLDLSAELIVQVFKDVNNISTAAALSQTSRYFHAVWRYHLPSICDTLLPRTIECYDQSIQLLEARALSEFPIVNQSAIEERAEAAIVRAKVLFTNADLAYLSFTQFEVEVIIRWEKLPKQVRRRSCPTMVAGKDGYRIAEPSTRSRFLHGYYSAMIMIYSAGKNARKRYKLLASMNLLDFFWMMEAMEWIFDDYCGGPVPDEDAFSPGYKSLSVRNEVYVIQYWEDLMQCYDFLDLLAIDLVRLAGTSRPTNEIGIHCLSYRIILHRRRRHKTIGAEGIALAGLLPWLSEESSTRPGYELLAP